MGDPEIRTRVEGRRRLFDLVIDDNTVSHLVVHDLSMWVQGNRVRAGGWAACRRSPNTGGGDIPGSSWKKLSAP